VSIPSHGHQHCPAILFLGDDSGVPRPTLIYPSGYDSTFQECLLRARRRRAGAAGYNVLAFERPRHECGALHLRSW